MKLTLFFLVLFTMSSCANQSRRRGPNLTDIENDSPSQTQESDSTKTQGADRAPKGEIELGITGESDGAVIIDDSEEEGEVKPVKAEAVKTEPETKDKNDKTKNDKTKNDKTKNDKTKNDKKKKAKVDCKKEPEHESCVKTEVPETDENELIINTPPTTETPE